MILVTLACVGGPWGGGQQGEDFDTGLPTSGGDSGVDADTAADEDGSYTGSLVVEVTYSPEHIELCEGSVALEIEGGLVTGAGWCTFPDDGSLELDLDGSLDAGTVTSGLDTWEWTRESDPDALLVIWSGPDTRGRQHNGQFRVEWE